MIKPGHLLTNKKGICMKNKYTNTLYPQNLGCKDTRP